MLGQPASSHTVCRPPLRTRPFSSVYCGPVRARVRIHEGLRSIGVALLRTSRRRSLRPSGAIVTGARLRRYGASARGPVAWPGVDLGLGSGWLGAEHPASGIPFPPLRERFDRLAEQLEIITGLWRTPPGE